MARARALMTELGITRVANITGLDVIGIPVVTVCRPNARSLAVSQGKGGDLEAAKASGLMESIELYHAEHILRPLVLATSNDLARRQRVAATERLPRLSIGSFHADRQILWILAQDWLNEASTYVPFEMVHTNYTLPLPTGSGSFVMSSNGLASGNDLNEAALHALCEVIERDATTLWVLGSPEAQMRCRVDLDSVDDPLCRTMLEAYRRAAVGVAVWDITSDLGIPTFACMIVDAERSKLRLLYPTHGMGCHPVREVALSRALSEAAQGRLTFISGSRDDSGADKYRRAQGEQEWALAQARVADIALRSFAQCPSYPAESVDEDLSLVLTRLKSAGFGEALITDLSQPELGIPVVRAIVPGLEPLYEVPGYVPGARAQKALLWRHEASS